MSMCKTSLRVSIILGNNVSLILPGNAVFNVRVAFDAFDRDIPADGSTSVNVFLIAALLICMSTKTTFHVTKRFINDLRRSVCSS